MIITQVELFRISGAWQAPDFPPGNRQITPADLYYDGAPIDDTSTPRDRISATYVQVTTDDNISGIYGPIEDYQVFFIDHYLRDYLLGKDPLATELLFDQMLRQDRHGRSGKFMTAVSVVDCALWDLKGKVFGAPVYRLLGGPTRPRIPAYASMLGYSVEPEAAAQVAAAYKAQGYTAQKWFFRYGPAHGPEGIAKNVALAYALREAVGTYYPLMFDAYMGWDTNYAIQMGQAIRAMRPTWIEEPIPPERVGAFSRIKAESGVPIATGEHVYTRWQVRELLAANAVDYVQTDPDWCGGITELVKIIALCSAYEVPHVAHGHSLLPALHVAASQSPAAVPMVEYLMRHQPYKQHFHTPVYLPEDGHLTPPDVPGLGLTLDETKFDTRETLSGA